MSGTYPVGPGGPGVDSFATVQAAASALSSRGLAGNVEFPTTQSIYNGAVALRNVAGSRNFTTTFLPKSGRATIDAGGARYALSVENTHNVVLHALNLQGVRDTGSACVRFLDSDSGLVWSCRMVSDSAAAGDFPLESVQVMARVIAASVPINRRRYLEKFDGNYSKEPFDRIINVLGYPICELAEVANSPFIMSYATTGISATMISRFRPKMPILALTPNVETARLLRLLYTVCPVLVEPGGADLPRRPEDAIRFCRRVVEELGLVGEFDLPGRHIALTLQPRIPNVRSRSVIVFRW